jgi:methyl coenzyme M reductase alpha subunit
MCAALYRMVGDIPHESSICAPPGKHKIEAFRLSGTECYPEAADRLAIIERAAKQLVQDRLLLADDVQSFLQATN